MEGMALIAIIVAGLALLGVAATAIGVDSRIESTDPRRPNDPVGID
jgi:hypothetical protein